MPIDELVQRLAKVSPGQKSFLSVYLDLRPDGRGKKLYPVFLKSRLPELSKLLPAHASERSLLARDIKSIQRYLEKDLDPSWRGIALFACASEGLFLPVPMPWPPENALSFSPFPHLFSLIRFADLYQTYAVVVANSRQARLFLVSEGRPEKQISLFWEDKHTTRFGRMGWSLPKFQRHIQEHIKQRAKETVENLGKLIPLGKTEFLFTVAEEGMGMEMKKQLPSSLKKKQVPLPSLDTHDPDHKILSGAFEALQKISREKAEALARHILEEAQPLGRGTAGPEPTLSALQNHQVERLVFDGRFQAHGWRCSKCGFLGMGGLPGACPLCQGKALPVELREDIVLKAQAQGVELFFTEKFSPLVKVGGVAALLKFNISSGTRKQASR
jgi:peptide chain release factor subunit 1